MKLRNTLLSLNVFDHNRINVNSQRIVKRNPEVFRALEAETAFLGDASLKERIFAVFAGITSRPICSCGNRVLFEERGKPRYRSACSGKCAAQVRLKTLGPEGVAEVSAKRKSSMLKIGADGKTTFQRMYDKQHETKVKKGIFVPRDKMTAKQRYHSECWRITRSNDLSKLPNFHLRGKNGNPGAFQIDHKISISYGFLHGISPSVIGHFCNLEMIPWESNVKKNYRCSISLEELSDRISKRQS